MDLKNGVTSQVLASAFVVDTSPEGSFYYAPITEVKGIQEANARAFVDTKYFENAFDDITIMGAEQLRIGTGSMPVVRVSYSLPGGGR